MCPCCRVPPGIRLCKAQRRRYKHLDLADLEKQLQEAQSSRLRLIVTDGVFSMDGDVAPLKEICDLADKCGDDCCCCCYFATTSESLWLFVSGCNGSVR